MARPRSAGPISFERLPSISSSPSLISSRPAIIRNRLVLPQPDGPTKTTNSWSGTSRSTPLIASKAPKNLRTPRIDMGAIPGLLCLFDGAERQALDQLALAQPAEDQDRRDGNCGSRRQFGEEQPL